MKPKKEVFLAEEFDGLPIYSEQTSEDKSAGDLTNTVFKKGQVLNSLKLESKGVNQNEKEH